MDGSIPGTNPSTAGASTSAEKRGIVKPFSSPGGNEVWRELILAQLPTHKTYVEVYAGSATIFWAKSKTNHEVLADTDPEIINCYKFLRDGSDDDFTWMRDQTWVWDPTHFSNLRKSKPKKRRDRAYRFKYLNLFSKRGEGIEISTTARARESTGKRFLDNLESFRKRLEGVELLVQDAIETLAKFGDDSDTLIYIDPPWKPVSQGSEWKGFDAQKFASAITSLTAKAIVSYQGEIDLGERWSVVKIESSLGGIGRSSEQSIWINFEASKKGCACTEEFDPCCGWYEGGNHSHKLDRERSTTQFDGEHSHLFMIGDRVYRVGYGGDHLHMLTDPEAGLALADTSAHYHSIEINGQVYETDLGGEHAHELLDGWTAYDGVHQHTLTIGETSYPSMSPGEFWSAFRKARTRKPFPNEHAARQKDPDQYDSFRRSHPEGFPDGIDVIYGIKNGVSEIQSLRFDADSWSASEAKDWLKDHDFTSSNFEEASGKKFTYPTTRKTKGVMGEQLRDDGIDLVFATVIDDQRQIWLIDTSRKMVGSPQPFVSPFGDRWRKSLVDQHLRSEQIEASTIKASPKAIDRFNVEMGVQTADTREFFLSDGAFFSGTLIFKKNDAGWTARLSKSDLPLVLRGDVDRPDDRSCLPASLEASIPEGFRYWLGEASHEQVLASKLIEHVRIVDKRLTRCAEAIVPAPEIEATSIDQAHECVSWRDPNAKVAKVLPSIAEKTSPEDLIAKLAKLDRPFLVQWPNSQDAQDALSDLGPVFRAKHDARWIFVSSDPLVSHPAFERVIDQSRVDELSKRSPSVELVCKQGEEQFVLGIVLEPLGPDEPDLQGDYYSKEEIRKACHAYMEKHGNAGLMHRTIANDKIKVLENYLAPIEFTIKTPDGEDRVIREGTWLIGFGIRDAEIWSKIKSGEYEGPSIGGFSRREPRSRSSLDA